MKSVAVMQPYLFPYIGYFHLIKAVDVFVIFDDVNFIKKGWINRNNILLKEHAYLWSLPLVKTSQNRFIKDHDIFEPLQSKQKLLQLFIDAYQKAPEFEKFYPVLKNIMEDESINLADFVNNSLRKLCDYMKIDTQFMLSSEIPKNENAPASERIIQVTKHLGGKQYYNAIGGQDLYSKEEFAENDLPLSFVKSGSIHYPQFGDGFVPFLSILDVIMFNNQTQLQDHLTNYELV